MYRRVVAMLNCYDGPGGHGFQQALAVNSLSPLVMERLHELTVFTKAHKAGLKLNWLQIALTLFNVQPKMGCEVPKPIVIILPIFTVYIVFTCEAGFPQLHAQQYP